MDLVRHGTSRAAPSWTWTLWTPRAQFRRGLAAPSLVPGDVAARARQRHEQEHHGQLPQPRRQALDRHGRALARPDGRCGPLRSATPHMT